MANIYTVIVTYNGLKNNWIKKCIDSLENSEIPLPIIVVDNNSADGTVRFIKENYPGVILLESAENLGFGKANNIGIKKAIENNADYFFLLNQDAYIQPDTVKILYNAMEKEPEYGIVSPMHMNGSGTKLDFNFSNYIGPRHCKELCSDFVTNTIQNRIYESQFINAAAWLISRKCIETVGGFSPVFYHYGEDVNYIHRLQYKNFRIGVQPAAFIFHDRENRVDNKKYDLAYYTKKNALRIATQFSDPNNKESETVFLASKVLKLIISTLKFNKLKHKILRFEIGYYLKNRKAFRHYLDASKSGRKFTFIQ